MSEYIGKMTKEEFLEALNIIKSYKEQESDKKECKKRNIKDHWNSFINDSKRDIILFLRFVYNILNLVQLFNNLSNFLFEPLTKEVFIRRGIKCKKFFMEFWDTVIFVVVMIVIIRFCFGEIRWIPSGSMHPTLIEGDRIFVERYTRFYETPQRGDIMVFYPPSTELRNTPWKLFSRLTGFFCKDIAYIKRVVGLPGEKFEIKTDELGKSTVYINDEPLEEPYVESVYDFSPCTFAMNCGPLIIPDGQYFMMGDNRGNSQDSRYWGTLPVNRFIGKATYLFWPVDRKKSLIFK